MPNDNPQTTDDSLEWFTENLPTEYLKHPEYFLYSTALDVQQMQDIPENRRRFKKLLVERQLSEGIELPEIDQKQLHDFMNPNDRVLKLQRSEELLELTTRHLEQTQDFAQAKRLAILELFHREAPFRQAEMNESYFKNRELVEVDLRGFLGRTDKILLKDLLTNNPKRTISIQTQSGELIAWRAYLDHASGVLFNTKQGWKGKKSENPHRQADALKALLKIAGVDVPAVIDEAYFNNSEIVKADLTAYLKHAEEGDSLKDLNTNDPEPSVSIQSQSGELVRWETYLDRASAVLFGTKSRGANPHRRPDALKALLKIAGIEIPETTPMDEKYFTNPEYVKADLTAYFEFANGNSLTDLSTVNPEYSVSIQTQSGEPVRWVTYLGRASGVLLGTRKRTDNPHRRSDAIKALLKIAGIDIPETIPMDEKYFNNPEYVKADLTAYLQNAEGDSLKDLNTNNPEESVSIQTQSGEPVRWGTYLDRASGSLFKTKQSWKGKKSENPHRPPDALKTLLKIAGMDISEYIPMNKEYFNNSDVVKADLTAYLQHAEGGTLVDLHTQNPKWSVSIQTQSGERVTWEVYLNRASGVLFRTKYKSKNPHRPSDTLKVLLSKVGLDVPAVMDETYFNDSEIVKADLAAYLQHAKGDSLKDLHTNNPEFSVSILSQSGEYVKWNTYLCRASGVFFNTKAHQKGKKNKNPHRRPDALTKLIQIAFRLDRKSNGE